MLSYSKDTIVAKDGSNIELVFYAHASVGIEWNGIHVYVDPVGERYNIDFAKEPKADLILVSHHHTDHLDTDAIKLLKKEDTVICANDKCCTITAYNHVAPNLQFKFNGIKVTCVAAFNTTAEHLKFHPKEDKGVGYLLNIGGTSFYFAGDTEDNPEVLSLRNVDVAFLPVNQPYTMTVEQVAHVAKIIRPKVLYPYHYGSQMGVTDVTPLINELAGICEVRIRKMM